MRKLTVAEAAHAMRVSTQTVRRKIADGTIPAERVGRKFLIPEEGLHVDLAPSAVERAIEQIVDAAPPLSADQLAALRVILRAGR